MIRIAAVSAAVVSSATLSACEYASYDDDNWGKRLIAFLRTGDETFLDKMFADDSTLVAFDPSLIADTNRLSFSGVNDVRRAMIGFRKQQMSYGNGNGDRGLKEAVLVGSQQQGRMNKIQIIFADNKEADTSCGPTRSEAAVDLFYEADVHDVDGVKWSIERLALLPRLENEKFNG